MAKQVKDKFKVIKYEDGLYEYGTIFICINKSDIQIPIKKDIVKGKDVVNKTILIPCELLGENEYLFNKEITELEFM